MFISFNVGSNWFYNMCCEGTLSYSVFLDFKWARKSPQCTDMAVPVAKTFKTLQHLKETFRSFPILPSEYISNLGKHATRKISKLFKATAYQWTSCRLAGILSADFLDASMQLLSCLDQRTNPVYVCWPLYDSHQSPLSGCGPRNAHHKMSFFTPIILRDYLSFNLFFPQINGKCFWLFSNGPWPRTLHLVLVKKNQTVEMWSGIRPYWASGPLRTPDSLIKSQYNCQSPLKANLKSCEWIWQHVEGDKKMKWSRGFGLSSFI